MDSRSPSPRSPSKDEGERVSSLLTDLASASTGAAKLDFRRGGAFSPPSSTPPIIMDVSWNVGRQKLLPLLVGSGGAVAAGAGAAAAGCVVRTTLSVDTGAGADAGAGA